MLIGKLPCARLWCAPKIVELTSNMTSASLQTRAQFAAGVMVGLLCLAAPGSAGAQTSTQPEEGFYVGLGFGPSTFDQSKADFDAGVFGSLANSGFTVLNPVSQLDDSGTALQALVGYRLNPYFGFELAFVDT